MVKVYILILISFLAIPAISQEADNNPYTADALESMFKEGTEIRQSAADRIKASRVDKTNLRLLREKDINYKLPNGNYVIGILLPNGKVAPAVRINTQLHPACVTKDYRLVPGSWDNKKQVIQCELKNSELAYLLDSGIAQEGQEDIRQQITKYDSAGRPISSSEVEGQNDNSVSSATKTGDELSGANKYGQNSSRKAGGDPQSSTRPVTRDTYTPPPRNSTNSSSQQGVLRHKQDRFGISMGTWIQAEMLRSVSSAESGKIEFKLLESVEGRIKDLPIDTVLFATKRFNETARRLEALTSTAILPNGDEYNGISAYIYADDKTAGLSGTIVRDREGELLAAGTKTLLSTAAQTISTGVGGDAVTDLTDSLLSNEEDFAPENPNAYIQVVKQRVWLKVSKTF